MVCVDLDFLGEGCDMKIAVQRSIIAEAVNEKRGSRTAQWELFDCGLDLRKSLPGPWQVWSNSSQLEAPCV